MVSIGLGLLLTAVTVNAAPVTPSQLLLLSTSELLLPVYDALPAVRYTLVAEKRHGFLYGTSLMGNTSYFPSGLLGDEMVLKDIIQFDEDDTAISTAVVADTKNAIEAIEVAGGIKNLEDYSLLYKDQWKLSVPSGIDQGVFANATQDLQFAMERLSDSPYTIKRLHPTEDALPFSVDSSIVSKLAMMDLKSLHSTGHLFYVDYSSQLVLPKTKRFSAACSAYFFIHPTSGNFLPLAIKTNVGSDLVYTPLDKENDWLLAKIMFNSNDVFSSELYHLAATHAVTEIVHQAAMRTLSDNHPVLGLLNRLMYGAYGPRPAGQAALMNPGGAFDTYFGITGSGAALYTAETYKASAGAYQANYLLSNLNSRGLINCTYGPALKSFPYLEDASSIFLAIKRFIASFVASYYASDVLISLDNELQDWMTEATLEALVIDFPPAPISNTTTLADILTHFAFLAGVVHNTLNGGDPVSTSSTLPWHPASLHEPLPITKGITNILPWLPNANTSIGEIGFFARFNRPFFAAKNLTLSYAFSDPNFLARSNDATKKAAGIFHAEMEQLSTEIRGRKFDGQGLSQCMPFIWRALDPGAIPFSCVV